MKKLLAILLVCAFAFSVVACGGSEEPADESVDFGNSSVDDESSEAPSDEPSDEPSEDPSEDSSDTSVEEPAEPKPTQFISWANSYYNGITGLKATDATSLALTKFNAAVEAGDTAILTRGYGTTIGKDGVDYADFAVVVFEYDHSVWGYVKKDFQAVGSVNAETAIPMDGFVAVISKDNAEKIAAIEAVSETTPFYPHGFVATNGLDATISKAETAPNVDGAVSEEEYGAVVWDITSENPLFSYAQFEVNNYNATAKVYLTYDENYLYCGIVVNTPDHHCTVTQDNPTAMWNQTCIQVNTCSVDPTGEYMMSGMWNQSGGVHDAANANIVRQYGIAVNDSNETVTTIFMPSGQTSDMLVLNNRDNDAQITTYEFAIPWTDIGAVDQTVVPEVGTVFGFSISVNSGTAEKEFQNIIMRDSGGIIGINDWSKIPAITLGE